MEKNTRRVPHPLGGKGIPPDKGADMPKERLVFRGKIISGGTGCGRPEGVTQKSHPLRSKEKGKEKDCRKGEKAAWTTKREVYGFELSPGGKRTRLEKRADHVLTRRNCSG